MQGTSVLLGKRFQEMKIMHALLGSTVRLELASSSSVLMANSKEIPDKQRAYNVQMDTAALTVK